MDKQSQKIIAQLQEKLGKVQQELENEKSKNTALSNEVAALQRNQSTFSQEANKKFADADRETRGEDDDFFDQESFEERMERACDNCYRKYPVSKNDSGLIPDVNYRISNTILWLANREMPMVMTGTFKNPDVRKELADMLKEECSKVIQAETKKQVEAVLQSEYSYKRLIPKTFNEWYALRKRDLFSWILMLVFLSFLAIAI